MGIGIINSHMHLNLNNISNLHKIVFLVGYIDPSLGHVYSSSISSILAFIASFFVPLLLFFRKKLLPFFKKPVVLLLAIFSIMVGSYFLIQNMFTTMHKDQKKVIILGFDGMDPKLISKWMQEGLLPHFKKLKDSGFFSELATVMPPQSPVAWASFITGSSPSKHAVYDFLTRDPKTYSLDLSFSKKENQLKKPPFWQYLTKKNIPSTILFLPNTFPAQKLNGKMISGMGTPDVLGTMGTFTLFSTKQKNLDKNWRGKYIEMQNKNIISTFIEGPRYSELGEEKKASIPIEFNINQKAERVTISIQGAKFTLSKGAFSEWIPLEFKIDFFTRIYGIARFYIKSISPEVEIYMSPININPEKPIEKISYPANYAIEIKKKFGYFSTLGLPYDTWALEQDIFDNDAFLKSVNLTFEERKKIYFHELSQFSKGLLFAYFGETDTIQHMFWSYQNDDSSFYKNTVLIYYQKMDEILGKTMEKLDKNTRLIVLSDHGFASFDYEFNLNTWLKENGYLVLEDGVETGEELLGNIDWSKTKAYAIGYNGIYINLKDREGKGIVSLQEKNILEKEISEKLLNFINPYSQKKVFKHIYQKKELGINENDTSSPDLFIGYYAGTRASWDTAVGATPKEIVVKRTDRWSGDHLFDASEVPGILFLNYKPLQKPKSIDQIIPFLLKFTFSLNENK